MAKPCIKTARGGGEAAARAVAEVLALEVVAAAAVAVGWGWWWWCWRRRRRGGGSSGVATTGSVAVAAVVVWCAITGTTYHCLLGLRMRLVDFQHQAAFLNQDWELGAKFFKKTTIVQACTRGLTSRKAVEVGLSNRRKREGQHRILP